MGNTVRCLFIALVLQSYMAPQIIAVENELCCFLTIADSSGDATPPPNVSVFPMFPCFRGCLYGNMGNMGNMGVRLGRLCFIMLKMV